VGRAGLTTALCHVPALFLLVRLTTQRFNRIAVRVAQRPRCRIRHRLGRYT